MALERHKGCSVGGRTERARAEQGVVRGPRGRGTLMAGWQKWAAKGRLRDWQYEGVFLPHGGMVLPL